MARFTSMPRVSVRNGTSSTPPMPTAPIAMPMTMPVAAMEKVRPKVLDQ